MRARDKIIKNIEVLAKICEKEKMSGKVVAFTNGCFDLLHIGHLRYLESAKECGDILIVAINSDLSVRRIKGYPRPIVGEEERLELVAGFHCVDYVTCFDTVDPLPVIELLKPDVLVKGADWPLEKIAGASFVRSYGGRVVRVPLVNSRSTTRLINHILSAYSSI